MGRYRDFLFPVHLPEPVVALFVAGDEFGFVAGVVGVFGFLLGAEQVALCFGVFSGSAAHFFLSSLRLFFRKKVAQMLHPIKGKSAAAKAAACLA